MKTIVVAITCAIIVSGTVRAQAIVTNRLATPRIVHCRDNVNVDGVIRDYGIQTTHVYHRAIKGFAAALDAATISKLGSDSRVRGVGADSPVHLLGQTIPAGVLRMGMNQFPEAQIDGIDHRIDIDVAVIDTGIQTNHPDLNVVGWVDLAGTGLNGNDWNGHGTYVAGIIGALDNGIGVVGVAPGVRLWAVQVFGESSSSWGNIIAGCEYVLQLLADGTNIAAANMSLGGSADGSTYVAVRAAVQSLVSGGVVVIAAAGNGAEDIAGPDMIFGCDNTNYALDDLIPAAFPETMAVSAMDPAADINASFSDYSEAPRGINFVTSSGGAIDVAAPGVNIYSTWVEGNYITASGTSASAPHATGLVALYMAANGLATNAAGVYAIRQAIVNNSLPELQWNAANTFPLGLPAPLAMPSENWIPLPGIFGTGMTSAGFQLSFTVVPGYTYTAQQIDLLNSSNQWTSLSSTNGQGISATATITDLTANPAGSFYRLLRQPAP